MYKFVLCFLHSSPFTYPMCGFMMTLVTNESGRCVVRFSCILLVHVTYMSPAVLMDCVPGIDYPLPIPVCLYT